MASPEGPKKSKTREVSLERMAGHYEREARRAEAASKRARRDRDERGSAAWETYAARVRAAGHKSLTSMKTEQPAIQESSDKTDNLNKVKTSQTGAPTAMAEPTPDAKKDNTKSDKKGGTKSSTPAVDAAVDKAKKAMSTKSGSKQKPAAKKPAAKKPAVKDPNYSADASKGEMFDQDKAPGAKPPKTDDGGDSNPPDFVMRKPAITRTEGQPKNFGAKKLGDGGYNEDVRRYSKDMAAKPGVKAVDPTMRAEASDDGGMPTPAQPKQKKSLGDRLRGIRAAVRGNRSKPSLQSGEPAPAAATPQPAANDAPDFQTSTRGTSFQKGHGDMIGNTFGINIGGSNTGNIGGFNPSNQTIGSYNEGGAGSKGGSIVATTSGKATGPAGKGGIVASTSGTAKATAPSHPRAKNASRGGRPTTRRGK